MRLPLCWSTSHKQRPETTVLTACHVNRTRRTLPFCIPRSNASDQLFCMHPMMPALCHHEDTFSTTYGYSAPPFQHLMGWRNLQSFLPNTFLLLHASQQLQDT